MRKCCRGTVLLVLLVCPMAAGQYAEDPPAADSPYWWTLTEEITPQELMRKLQDRDENRRRYREAMETGLARKVSAERLAEVKIFLNGGQTPELTPMWDAFGAFASRFEGRPNGYPEAAPELERAGVSRGGIETILAIAHEDLRELSALREELGPKQRTFAKILGEARPILGRRFQEARDSRDITTFAGIAGRSEAEIADLIAAWERDPGVEVPLENLQQLRLELSPEDWKLFRAFLLAEVAPVMEYTAFEEE